MKTAGIVVAVFGGVMVLSSVRLAVTTYDLGDAHDVNKLIGGASVALLVVVVGLVLIMKSRGG